MVDWQITATTICCDAVDDEATIIVEQDGTVKCAAYPRYGQPDKKTAARMTKRARELGRTLQCEGPLCSRMSCYRDEQFSQQTEKG